MIISDVRLCDRCFHKDVCKMTDTKKQLFEGLRKIYDLDENSLIAIDFRCLAFNSLGGYRCENRKLEWNKNTI